MFLHIGSYMIMHLFSFGVCACFQWLASKDLMQEPLH